MSKNIDLTPELKKPMDRNLMNNDVAVLRSLVADMNNPALTGAVVPKEEKAATLAAPVDKHGASIPPVDPLTAEVSARHKEDERVRATVRQPSAEAVQLLKAEEAIVLQQLDFCRENGIVPSPTAGTAIRFWLANKNIRLAFKQLDELNGKNL
jgi:hypothetical protein